MNDIKLKPCPFCGCEAKIYVSCGQKHKIDKDGGILAPLGVVCKNIDCAASMSVYYKIADLAAAWNRREEYDREYGDD